MFWWVFNYDNVIFHIGSFAYTSKNGETTLFKAVNKLKDLAEKNGRGNDKGKFTGETQHVNLRHNNGRKKLGEDPNFFLDNNASQKKPQKNPRQ